MQPNQNNVPSDTRAQILSAAIRTATEQGAANFTLDAVVARAPFSKGALLHHFPNKFALLEAMVEQLSRAFTDAVATAAAADPDPYLREARAYLRATVDDVSSDSRSKLSRALVVACLIEPSLGLRWQEHLRRLQERDPKGAVDADAAMVLRLLADGLWFDCVTNARPISKLQRRAIAPYLGLPVRGRPRKPRA